MGSRKKSGFVYNGYYTQTKNIRYRPMWGNTVEDVLIII